MAEAGLSVCSIDPLPALVWPNNYDVWVDEFEAMGLFHCLDTMWPLASVFFSDGARPKSLNDIQECMAARLKQ
jgi:lycopene beta-cyclase